LGFLLITNLITNIAVALALLKAGDVVLRLHQKKAVQSFFEDMTLRIDDLDFKTISQRMSSQEAQFCFILLAYFEFTFIVLVGVFYYLLNSTTVTMLLIGSFGRYGVYIEAGIIILSYVTLAYCWKWPIPLLFSYIIGTGSKKKAILRFLVFVILSYIVFWLYQFGLYTLVRLYGNTAGEMIDLEKNPIYIAGLIFIWPLFIIFWILLQAIGALLQAKLFWTRWTFALIRAVLWRLVEYDKGAFAAIVLIVTVSLTVAKELT
jgi:hypothetical protein